MPQELFRKRKVDAECISSSRKCKENLVFLPCGSVSIIGKSQCAFNIWRMPLLAMLNDLITMDCLARCTLDRACFSHSPFHAEGTGCINKYSLTTILAELDLPEIPIYRGIVDGGIPP
jgi:hypothetical protein